MDDYLVPLPDMSFASPGSNNANTGATKSSADVSPEAKKSGNASSSINSKSKNMLITSSMLHWSTSEANMPKSTVTTANKMAPRHKADVKTFVVEGEEMYIASNIGNSSDYYVVL
jgi:hypothetical protein